MIPKRAKSMIWVLAIASLAITRTSHTAVAQTQGETDFKWFKGNLHTHSLWSDGNDFPEMIARWYRDRGYHFLALSDHNILSEGDKWIDETAASNRGAIGGLSRYRKSFGDDWVETRQHAGKLQVRLKPLNEFRALVESPGEFLLIQGEEITDRVGDLPVHVNASNLRDTIQPRGGQDVREALANNLNAIRQQAERIGRPILGHLNHPNFGYAFTAEDIAAVVQERWFEVFNGHPAVHHRGDQQHASTERLWDIANTLRIANMCAAPLYGLATDDSHNYFGLRDASPGRGWVMVRAAHLTPESIVKAIQLGEFYSSTGVVLNQIAFDAASGMLRIQIKGTPRVTYKTEFIGTHQHFDDTSTPVTDEQGNQVNATRKYSSDVGQVLAVVKGTQPTYRMTGTELYVRATITSSEICDNPVQPDQYQQAWTQPVGWRKHIEKSLGH